MKKKLAAITLSCVLLFSVAVLGINAQAPTEPKIVFMTDRDGNFEVYIMNKDGSNPQNLSTSLSPEYGEFLHVLEHV